MSQKHFIRQNPLQRKRKVLILCTGNSCRSQMAEGLLRNMAAEHYEVFSAGTEPTEVNPRAIKVMSEIGIDISGHKSKSVDEFLQKEFDAVITVCDSARETCPVFPNSKENFHWSFEDPAQADGSDTQIMEVFRDVREQIRARLQKYIKKRIEDRE